MTLRSEIVFPPVQSALVVGVGTASRGNTVDNDLRLTPSQIAGPAAAQCCRKRRRTGEGDAVGPEPARHNQRFGFDFRLDVDKLDAIFSISARALRKSVAMDQRVVRRLTFNCTGSARAI